MRTPFHPRLRLTSLAILIATLAACGSDIDPPKADPNTQYLSVDFNEDASGWSAGFADYPAGQESFYELSSGVETLPAALNTSKKGFALNGNNHSDDLFMFITRQYDGLQPNTRYDLRFKVVFGSNAQKIVSVWAARRGKVYG